MTSNGLIEKSISVSDLNKRIKGQFYDNPVFYGLYVFGEVSQVSYRSPHVYLTLKDKESQIKCTIWNVNPGDIPKEGESLIVRGSIDYYTKLGTISFIIKEIFHVGQGALYIEFEKLKAELLKEGLFNEDHKKPIPAYPKNVLVITSKDGAVIRDINTTIRRKNPILNIVVKDVRVQGENAAQDIVRACIACDKLGYDVIIIARGGGSLEDLAPFYDELLVRTIYDMNTPVISAVGHETDFSLCDFVADIRCATPTAAGELVGWDWYGLVDQVKENMEDIESLVNNLFMAKFSKLQLLDTRLQSISSSFYQRKVNKLRSITDSMAQVLQSKIQNNEVRVEKACAALDALSPLKTMSRGFFAMTNQEGKRVVSVEDVKIGQDINIRGKDGKILATVKDVEKKEE